MLTLRTRLLVLAALLFGAGMLMAEEAAKIENEYPSPNGRYAFRTTPETAQQGKAFHLIHQQTGADLAAVAEADVEPGPSARFGMEVLWRPDSRAFALTATLWKRGSHVAVYVRTGETFREVELPDLLAEIPEKVKGGLSYPHIAELNSQKARRWQKDGTLVVEIENMLDGNVGSITALHRVVLRLPEQGQAKVLQSRIRFTKEEP